MSCLDLACFAETACVQPDIDVTNSKVLLFKLEDVDFDALTFKAGAEGTLVTKFALKGAATGFAFDAITTEINGFNDENSFNAEIGVPEFTHSLTTRIYDNKGDGGKAFRAQLAYSRVVAAVDTSAGVQIIGLYKGLRYTEGSRSTSENNGAALVTLSTPEGKTEGYPIAEFRADEPVTTQFAELEALTSCP